MKPSTLAAMATVFAGLLFGFGLATATMIRPESVIAFLQFDDLGLLLVLGSAVMINLAVYQLAPRLMKQPLLATSFAVRPFAIDKRSFTGAVMFGAGWGVCGVCPGPALAGVGAGSMDLLVALAGIFIGALLHGLWESRRLARVGRDSLRGENT